MIPTAITAGASRVASGPLCLHAVATTPAGPMEPIRSLLLHRLRPSPDNSWVGSCIISFVACSAFTRVTTCRLAKSPYATLYTGGSGGFVASTAAPIATGWSDPVPGRVYLPLWTSAFHGALLTGDYTEPEPPQGRPRGSVSAIAIFHQLRVSLPPRRIRADLWSGLTVRVHPWRASQRVSASPLHLSTRGLA